MPWLDLTRAALLSLLLGARSGPPSGRCSIITRSIILRDVTAMGESFSFLLDAYRFRCYYWEAFDLLRKLILVGLVLLVKRGSVAQNMVALVLSLAFLVLQTSTKPYKLHHDNIYRAATELHVFLVIAAGLALRSDLSGEEVDKDWYDWALFVSFLVLVPGMFLFTVVWKVMSATKSLIREDSLAGSFERLRLGLASDDDRSALRTRVEAMQMSSSDTLKRIVVSSPEWATKDPEGNGPYDQPAMGKCKELQDLGVLKIAFDRANSSTTDERDKSNWEELKKIDTELQTNPDNSDLKAQYAEIIKTTYWFYGYATAVKRCIVLELQGFTDRLELICIKGGPITRVEAQEMKILVAGAKKDAELSDIVVECEIAIMPMSYYEFVEMYVAANQLEV